MLCSMYTLFAVIISTNGRLYIQQYTVGYKALSFTAVNDSLVTVGMAHNYLHLNIINPHFVLSGI